MLFRRALILSTALLVTGCATARDITIAGLNMLVETDPHRTVTTVRVGRETHTVTTHTSADGRRSTVRVD